MGKPRSKKQIHQDIDNYVIVKEEIIGNVPAGKFKNTITFNGIINPGTPMTINQLAALIAGLTTTVNDLSTTVNDLSTTVNDLSTTVNDLSTTVTNQHNLVMGEIKAIKQDIVEIKLKLDEHDAIFARNNLK